MRVYASREGALTANIYESPQCSSRQPSSRIANGAMKVLILGASGYTGLPVAQAFARAGHTDYGVTRSAAKAKQLAADENIPIVGAPDTAPWPALVPTLDAIVEALAALAPALLARAARTAASTRAPGAPRLAYVYTSGVWLHGGSRTAPVGDTTPLPRAPAPAHGRAVRARRAGARCATVHADDLAELYVRAAERAPAAAGCTFLAARAASESVDALLRRAVAVTGAEGYAYTAPSSPVEVAVAQSAVARPYLARALLGWAPRKASLVDGLEGYYHAFLAAAEDGEAASVQEARLGIWE